MKKTIELTLEEAKSLYGKDDNLDKILEINFPNIKSKLPIKWEDLPTMGGYYITRMSNISSTDFNLAVDDNKNIFATHNQAESALAYAQLTQLMKYYAPNDDKLIDWTSEKQVKYCIIRKGNEIIKDYFVKNHFPIAFLDKDIRDMFFDAHMDLLKIYFQAPNK